ncbi:MAG: hypothetical protein Q9165_004024 [Trypethelium subeluteriae]
MPPSTNLRRVRAPQRNGGPASASEGTNNEASGASSNSNPPTNPRNRPRATPSGRYNRSHRRRQEAESFPLSGGLPGLQEAGVRLAQITSNIEEILDGQNPSSLSRSLHRSLSPEIDHHQHRTKRRKLDSGKSDELTYHKYGWYGQVEPTRLKMEIASCDGGHYAEERDSTQYRPENVLRKNKRVYCTKRSTCDMVLRHQGETPFSVEKILIKAPDRHFTAPVQEGMVFVAMTSDDLLRRTAGYTAGHATTRAATPLSPSATGRSRERLTLLESLHDPVVSEAARRQNGEDVPPHALRVATRERRFAANNSEDSIADNCDPPLDDGNAPISRTAVTTSIDPPTASSDSEEDSSDEEGMSPVDLADRLRQEGRWPPTHEEDEAFQYQVIREWREAQRQARNGPRARTHRRSSPPRGETEEPVRRAGGNCPTTSREGMIVPNARFRMKDSRHQITIKFDPPLSGKYILIKLWSPTVNGNIDIQSITTYGYSGPRFIPAFESR